MKSESLRRVYAVSLGCPKARVDLEAVLADLLINGWEYVGAPEHADLFLVNTCAFLESARQETLETIRQLHKTFPDTRIISTGCMVEGFKGQIRQGPSEPLAGTKDMMMLASYLGSAGKNHIADSSIRLVTTPIPTAYLKVAEGCNRRCSFCIIPKLRGKQHSRPIDSLQHEAVELVAMGYKEVVLIAQDLTAYGKDIGTDLPTLLKALEEIDGLRWLRMMYLHPAGITEQLLEVVADSQTVLPYFDIPVQHVSEHILRAMRRGTPQRKIQALFARILARVPDAVFRTTLITGFPGETHQDFDLLVDFVRHQPIMLGGVFAYSPEPLSASYNLPDRVAPDIVAKRQQALFRAMQARAKEMLDGFVGKRIEAMINERIGDSWLGRTWFQAPEGIDGNLVARGDRNAGTGFWEVEVERIKDYTVYGRLICRLG